MKKSTLFRKFLTDAACIALCAVMLLTCSSCGLDLSAKELSESYTRQATETGDVSDKFIASMTDFSFSLFKGLVTESSGNALVSPLSAAICLAMLANGTDGETKAQIENVFGMTVDELNKSLYAYITDLSNDEQNKLNIADSIWFRDGKNKLHVKEEFLQANADWFDAQVFSAPFDDSTLTDINNWCEEHTDGKIKNIIDKIDTTDVMYLINALIFDSEWDEKYDKSKIVKGSFTNYDGSKSSVQYLSSEENVYYYDKGLMGFSKNYSGGRYSFFGLLPSERTDIYDFISSLDGEKWAELTKTDNKIKKKEAVIPAFSYNAEMNMNDTLKSMGIVDIFGENANLSKLGYLQKGDLYLSEVFQKTFIQVDERGTKAAAVTEAKLETYSSIAISLCRPFVYAIVDNMTGLPVFIGAVTEL